MLYKKTLKFVKVLPLCFCRSFRILLCLIGQKNRCVFFPAVRGMRVSIGAHQGAIWFDEGKGMAAPAFQSVTVSIS
jgi:hypothetical protein